jgi:hypothetical protein
MVKRSAGSTVAPSFRPTKKMSTLVVAHKCFHVAISSDAIVLLGLSKLRTDALTAERNTESP